MASNKKYFVNKNILIISPESWDHLFVSKHNYAIELSKSNNVFFLGPPTKQRRCDETEYPRLFRINYPPFIKGLRFLPPFVKRFMIRRRFKALQRTANVTFDCVWSFDNSVFFDFSALPKNVVTLSHIVDYSQNFQFASAASTADICLGVSQNIVDRLRKHNPNSFLMPHGLQVNQFIEKNITLPGKNPIKAVYAGNLNSQYLEKDSVVSLVKANASVDFIFLGSGGENWPEIENFFILGKVPHIDLLSYYQQADVLLLLYNTKGFSQQLTNAHKVLEYLFSGKVIVSTFLSDYKNSDLLEMVTDGDNLDDVFKNVISNLDFYNDQDHKKRRIDHARQNTYARRLEEIERLLMDFNQ